MDDVEKRADRKIVALLVSAGVDVAARTTSIDTLFDQDAPPPRPTSSDPPFTIDDLIDFHFRLQDDAAIQAFLQRQ